MKVIVDGDVVLIQQSFDKVGGDEASTPGDENPVASCHLSACVSISGNQESEIEGGAIAGEPG